MSKELEVLKKIRQTFIENEYITKEDLDNFDIIEKDLILLNGLRNKLNRKIETKEYKHEESNRYHIATLLTYEIKEQWDDMEIQTLKQFLLNLSGISKELKALEIIKTFIVDIGILLDSKSVDEYNHRMCLRYYTDFQDFNSKPLYKALGEEHFNSLKEVLS